VGIRALRLREISSEEYRGWFEQEAPGLADRSPFHHPGWLEAATVGIGFGLRFIGIVNGQDLVAAVPGFLTRRGPFKLFGSPLRGTMTAYLGPVGAVRDVDRRQLVIRCSRFARDRWGVTYTRFAFRDAPAEGRSGLGRGWRESTPRSYRLDLTAGSDALWSRLQSDCRRNIRKAERLGITTVAMTDAQAFYEMLEETLRRHGSVSWQPAGFFRRLMEALPSQELLWTWGALYEDKIIAAGLFLHDDNEVHYLSGASRPEYGSLPTSYLLHWHAIQAGAQAGLNTFHSEASKVRSIDQFKESFRPEPQRRHSLTWTPRLVSRAEKVYKQASRRLRRWKTLRNEPS
jgi:CelD/BcsL family acetyltransferase involved in cellulose biosynthesis